MRVIAGNLGGRQFQSPKGHRTHPMSERARGGLFNVLGDLNQLTVLDPFAGSGALAIEAISRGASRAVAIEPDSNAFKVVNQNIKDLGLEDKIKATKAYFKAWSARNLGQSFDLILADPPYDHPPLEDIETLSKHLNQTGILVLSWPGQQTALQLKNLKQVQAKSYGDAQLVFYKKIS